LADQAFGPLARAIPDRVDDGTLAERIGLGLAATGVDYVRAAGRSEDERRRVARAALAALDRWQADQAIQPSAARDWVRLAQTAAWRAELAAVGR
jgi:hypothetical protein